MSRYTEQDITFMREYLPIRGATWCAKHLKRHPESVRKKGLEYGLSRSTRERADEDRNVNPAHFRDIKLAEVAYFLGYFWADGHIHAYVSGKQKLRHHRIAIEVQKEDGDHLRRIVKTFGRWAVVERARERYGVACKPTLSLVINNEPVYQFLFDHGFDTKSLSSSDLIVNKIPEELRPAFWLGYFDGDGTIVTSRPMHRTRYRSIIQFAGAYDQQWDAMEAMLNSIGVKYSIYRRKTEHGNSAVIGIQNRPGIHAFYDYIKPFERLGLPRKQAKLKQFALDHPKQLEARVEQESDVGEGLVT